MRLVSKRSEHLDFNPIHYVTSNVQVTTSFRKRGVDYTMIEGVALKTADIRKPKTGSGYWQIGAWVSWLEENGPRFGWVLMALVVLSIPIFLLRKLLG